jgi:MFS transporter, DHA2 family, multidrug resistance protein
LNGDGSALYTMFRNVAGSIGIAGSTALTTSRMQAHQSYLSQWATPFHQPFNDLVARYQASFVALGNTVSAAHDLALGKVYQVFRQQVAILAYSDIFIYLSVIAFAMVPVCFLLSPRKGRGGAAPGGH